MNTVSSLYLHFPVCLHLCNYCDFFRIKQDKDHLDFNFFHDYLDKGASKHKEMLEAQSIVVSPLETIFFGGGTPSLWGAEGAIFFQKYFKQASLKLATSYEWSMELNPGSWAEDDFNLWLDLGVNRVSVGIQSLDDSRLQILNRVHNVEGALKTLRHLQALKLNFSVDLMIGLPELTLAPRNLKAEIDRILEFGPSHFSVYILTPKAGYKYIDALPQDNEIADQYEWVSNYLADNGFHHYEVSNFALAGKESRHNQKYWDLESVMAIGPSGTGYLNLGPDRAIRYKWKTQVSDFEIENLGPDEMRTEQIFLGMRTSKGLDLTRFFNSQQLISLDAQLSEWRQSKLIKLRGHHLMLTSQGFLVMDSLVGKLLSISK